MTSWCWGRGKSNSKAFSETLAQNVRPPVHVVQPVVQNVRPVTQNVQLVAQNVQPVAQNVRPVTQNVQPVTQNVKPVAQNVRPVTQNVRPVAQNVRLVAQNARAISQNARPRVAGDRFVTRHYQSQQYFERIQPSACGKRRIPRFSPDSVKISWQSGADSITAIHA